MSTKKKAAKKPETVKKPKAGQAWERGESVKLSKDTSK